MSAALPARPLSVSIIAWLLVAASIEKFIITITIFRNPTLNTMLGQSSVPVPLQCGFMCLSAVIMAIAGIGMLKAKNWARYLYVSVGAISIFEMIFTFILNPSSIKNAMQIQGAVLHVIIIPPIVYAVQAYFLYRPKANEYFKRSTPGKNV